MDLSFFLREIYLCVIFKLCIFVKNVTEKAFDNIIYIRLKCCLCWWQGGCTGWIINVGISYCAPCLSERYSVSRVSRERCMSIDSMRKYAFVIRGITSEAYRCEKCIPTPTRKVVYF